VALGALVVEVQVWTERVMVALRRMASSVCQSRGSH
jgi:hypothetical protein